MWSLDTNGETEIVGVGERSTACKIVIRIMFHLVTVRKQKLRVRLFDCFYVIK